jgi:hypothetical protein
MPLQAPGSLSNDEVYATSLYVLAANHVIPQTMTLDSSSMRRVKMPYVAAMQDERPGYLPPTAEALPVGRHPGVPSSHWLSVSCRTSLPS